MDNERIYTLGGTVQAGSGLYIERKADQELLQYCRMGEFAYILASRQVGKSSLMIRTAEQLERENIHSVTIDLSSIGVKVSAEEWYYGIIHVIASTLTLKTDILAWWTQERALPPVQRFTNFLRNVMLEEITEPIVLFVDEIDTTLELPFSDDFFAAIRATYNARATTPAFRRLSVVMIGVATPSDLIADEARTPFNIGRRVELTDFTVEEAAPLAGDLDLQTVNWVLYWTGGHPYLTQTTFARLSEKVGGRSGQASVTEETVAKAVREIFVAEQGKNDYNLQFVRDAITKGFPDSQRMLRIYKDICLGKRVPDDESSISKSHLKLTGVVRRDRSGNLVQRNRIYEQVFDLNWIRENTPVHTTRKFTIASSLVALIALMVAGYFAWQDYNRSTSERAAAYMSGFLSAPNSEDRLRNLSGLFSLGDQTYARNARALFNNLSTEDQLALFEPTTSSRVREDQATVVQGLYQHMRNTEQGNRLLEAMAEAVPSSANEIMPWLAGRKELNEKDYHAAKANFDLAITENPKNPALYYDRAMAYIGLGEEYSPYALSDLNTMIELDKSRSSDAYRLVHSRPQISYYWRIHGKSSEYLALADAITTPMVRIDAGEFTMGSTPEDIERAVLECREQVHMDCQLDDFDEEVPQHQVYVDTFFIDQYEVTNSRYSECVTTGVCQPPRFKSSNSRDVYYGNAEFDNFPVVYISWFEANTYCQWRGARLPTEAEWEKASRGTDGRQYPWGEELVAGFTNVFSSVGDTVAVGSYENGKSPYDVYDMAGNVWEWVSDWYSETYYQEPTPANPTGPPSGEIRVLRGGAWNSYGVSARTADRHGADPTTVSFDIGFRCASDIAP